MCKKYYTRAANLAKHMTDYHSLASCEFCSESFPLAELRIHREIHLDLFYRCFVCKDVTNFKTKNDAVNHFKQSHGENIQILCLVREKNGEENFYDRSSYVPPPIENDPKSVAAECQQEIRPNLNPWVVNQPPPPCRSFSNNSNDMLTMNQLSPIPELKIQYEKASENGSGSVQSSNPWNDEGLRSSQSFRASSVSNLHQNATHPSSEPFIACSQARTSILKAARIPNVSGQSSFPSDPWKNETVPTSSSSQSILVLSVLQSTPSQTNASGIPNVQLTNLHQMTSMADVLRAAMIVPQKVEQLVVRPKLPLGCPDI